MDRGAIERNGPVLPGPSAEGVEIAIAIQIGESDRNIAAEAPVTPGEDSRSGVDSAASALDEIRITISVEITYQRSSDARRLPGHELEGAHTIVAEDTIVEEQIASSIAIEVEEGELEVIALKRPLEPWWNVAAQCVESRMLRCGAALDEERREAAGQKEHSAQ